MLPSNSSFAMPSQGNSSATFVPSRSRGSSLHHPPTSRVRLCFAATNLADMDVLSKSDPYVLLEAMPGPGSAMRRVVGRTETIRDNLNPVWKEAIAVDYHFEVLQTFAYTVYDDDGKGPTGDDVLGRGSFLLAHVVSGRKSTLEIKLQPRGTLRVHAESPGTSARDTATLQFAASGLTNKALWGGNNCLLRLHRLLPNGSRKLVHQSELRPGTSDPRWTPTPALKLAEISAGSTGGGAMNTKCLVVECVHKRGGPFGSEKKLGQVRLGLDDLLADAGRNVLRNGAIPAAVAAADAAAQRATAAPPLMLANPANAAKTYGQLHVAGATVTHHMSFTELLGAGLTMNLAVAIDFTASNGDPKERSSLHYHGGANGSLNRRGSVVGVAPENEYFRATQSVTDILMEYDSDRLVPCFGFGAVVPNGTRGSMHSVSHCFHLNGQADPHVHDVKGILDAYLYTLARVRLSGPTHFAPVIRQATSAARATPSEYAVLLILTDGCINDTDATIDAIVEADDAPLSIVIVGVGSADFTLMEMLDGDERVLSHSSGRRCRRDLVQFVPFRDFAHSPRHALAAEVLAEVPRQVEDWARATNFVPSPQLGGSDSL